MEIEDLEDADLVALFLKAAGTRSTRRAAQLADGISHDDVARWRGGRWGYLTEEKRRSLTTFLRSYGAASLGELVWRIGDVRSDTAGPSVPTDVIDLFGSLSSVTRFLEGIAPPGQGKDVKLDALEGYRRMITARRPLPHWWPELKRKIEEGEV